jgi:A/G-specific adenine glycosylase
VSEGFAERLLAWHRVHGRHDLPWQRGDAYCVWVSEIMLQQTQVATVIPYFERFIARFPALVDLARADRDEVLKLWSGLGYYARARNLHAAALIAAERHGGHLPATLEDLMALPGIGRSTAGAILALAHGKRVAILDGNVKRVLARYHAVPGWPGSAAVARELWERAERHTPQDAVADYTQAIMDLGATVCTRARPGCERCPVAAACAARRAGCVASFPAPRPRRPRPRRSVTALVVHDPQRGVLLERRPEHGVWGGLFSVPELADAGDVDEWCLRHLGRRPRGRRPLAAIEHAFTHFDLELKPVLVEPAPAGGAVLDRDGWLWYKPSSDPKVGTAAPIEALLRRLFNESDLNESHRHEA